MSITEKATQLCIAIEEAGASPELTAASVLAAQLRAEVEQFEALAQLVEAEIGKVHKKRGYTTGKKTWELKLLDAAMKAQGKPGIPVSVMNAPQWTRMG